MSHAGHISGVDYSHNLCSAKSGEWPLQRTECRKLLPGAYPWLKRRSGWQLIERVRREPAKQMAIEERLLRFDDGKVAAAFGQRFDRDLRRRELFDRQDRYRRDVTLLIGSVRRGGYDPSRKSMAAALDGIRHLLRRISELSEVRKELNLRRIALGLLPLRSHRWLIQANISPDSCEAGACKDAHGQTLALIQAKCSEARDRLQVDVWRGIYDLAKKPSDRWFDIVVQFDRRARRIQRLHRLLVKLQCGDDGETTAEYPGW